MTKLSDLKARDKVRVFDGDEVYTGWVVEVNGFTNELWITETGYTNEVLYFEGDYRVVKI